MEAAALLSANIKSSRPEGYGAAVTLVSSCARTDVTRVVAAYPLRPASTRGLHGAVSVNDSMLTPAVTEPSA